ncbi:hypothetical protein [[Mycobacterium] crassicus]|uniref:Uncharacterized protein n=1 Tax=[Mycobacterium] crassicus TaxID=2872309 RepID=A0ABU5XNY1_9MYCO|nr:hypothetical protein [Mycolicibacter sp. MYC098]MEB3023919.1 hypothetical protein [Mycolicibacter sp. MYC098]
MSESLRNRSAAIRQYLANVTPAINPVVAHRYSLVAARWEALRLLIDSGNGTARDDQRFSDLGGILRALTKQLGVPTCTDENRGADGIPGLTWPNGFLPGDPERILAADWREAARDW